MKPHLTPRQKEVVRLVSLGCTNEEAAAILGLSPATVDNHQTRAMRNLGTDKSVLVTRIALKHQFTSMKDQLTRTEKRKSGRKKRRLELRADTVYGARSLGVAIVCISSILLNLLLAPLTRHAAFPHARS